ncbi:MAG: DUF6786 family protein [Planctomycetota bacterium]
MSETTTIQAGDGGITVATRGARILDCRVDGVDENLFYDDGSGGGGDRLWIAPEVAYYWPSLEDARTDPVGTAETPADVDPGDYEVVGDYEETEDGGGLVLTNDCSLIDSRDEKAIGLQMTRSFAAARRPEVLPPQVKCVSFAIINTLEIRGGDDGAVASAWDILQVPPTGTLICPTKRKVDPRSYYDPFGEKHVVSDDTAVRFLIDAQRRVKMGIKPADTRGKMAYYRAPGSTSGSFASDGVSTLIYREFEVDLGGTYVDIPRDHPADQRSDGDALQAYNDDQTYGYFGEMEFVAPAVIVDEVETQTTGCVTHVIAGPDDAVRAAGEKLLGVAISSL